MLPSRIVSYLGVLLGLAFVLPTTALHAGQSVTPLSGRWTVTKLGATTPATPVGDITFDPDENSVAGATACNFFRGGYEVSGDRLAIKVGMMTRRACPGPAAEHERAFLEAMAKTHAFRIDGKLLTLVAADNGTLAELVSTPDAALEGQAHKIVSYLKDGGLYSVPAETGATITLRDGAIKGNTGCRPFTARYTRDGERLAISDVVAATVAKPCDESVRDQDAAILAGLPRATTFDTSRNLIRLLEKPDGNAVLWITPQTP